MLGSEDTDSGKSTQQGDVISGATIDLSGPPTQSAGPPNAKEIDWSLLLSLIKRKSYEEAANLMAIDPSLAKALQVNIILAMPDILCQVTNNNQFIIG